MVTLSTLCAYLDDYLCVEEFTDYCPNGLQIEGKEEIKKIVTAVSANLATIEAAVSEKADALIVHHGLFWNKEVEQGCLVGTRRKKIQLLLENQISLFAYHLPLDAHQEVGNNWKAARDLGWKELSPFGRFQRNYIGVKGTFAPLPTHVFIQQLETYYEHPAVSALGGKEMISSAALISGGAYREIQQAVKEKVDCFVTGNFDEPAWAEAHENKIHFVALGHSATEKVGPKALVENLKNTFGLSCSFIDIFNPF